MNLEALLEHQARHLAQRLRITIGHARLIAELALGTRGLAR